MMKSNIYDCCLKPNEYFEPKLMRYNWYKCTICEQFFHDGQLYDHRLLSHCNVQLGKEIFKVCEMGSTEYSEPEYEWLKCGQCFAIVRQDQSYSHHVDKHPGIHPNVNIFDNYTNSCTSGDQSATESDYEGDNSELLDSDFDNRSVSDCDRYSKRQSYRLYDWNSRTYVSGPNPLVNPLYSCNACDNLVTEPGCVLHFNIYHPDLKKIQFTRV